MSELDPAVASEILGGVGAVLILFGFYRTSIGRWTNKSFWYEFDNLLGAVLLSIYHLQTRTYASLVLNLVWAIVAFRGITTFADRHAWGKKLKKRKK